MGEGGLDEDDGCICSVSGANKKLGLFWFREALVWT